MKSPKLLSIGNGIIILVLVVGAILAPEASDLFFYALPQETAAPLPTTPDLLPTVDLALRQAILQAIVDEQVDNAKSGYLSPEGAILVEILGRDAKYAPIYWNDTPHSGIWKYESGAIRTATEAELTVYKEHRKNFEYIFVIHQAGNDRVQVSVATHYSKRDKPGFGQFGGHGDSLILKRAGSTWIVESKKPGMCWD